jgi:putative tryptophan/tyrosine transport system substrate-binding protein
MAQAGIRSNCYILEASMKRALVVRLLLIMVATCAATFSAGAQQPKKVPRIAYVYLYDVGPSAPYIGPFRARMRELGWIEGTNLIFETYDAGGNPDKLATIMRQLVDSNVDLIVASCTPEAKAAQKVTSTIPIVFAATGDPVKAGVVASLGRPGGNATGLAVQLLELSGKRMEILKEVSPGLRRATVLWNPVRPDNAPEVSALQQAARTLGFVIESQQVRSRDEIDVALDAILKDKSQAITETGDPLMASEMKRIIEFANGARLPAIYDERGYADAGGLMSYGPDLPTMNRRAADYVDKILKGAKPADLPVEQPTKFELVINMKTAKALGIPIPQSLLLRADAVIQ